ncbi:hypothetical protein T492DRAFT_530847 [Pavlovales sp. CCMP2436]|nr:hypothetical protein T492DRAFT_530847 [Pavlovales sp. CCMP2436]
MEPRHPMEPMAMQRSTEADVPSGWEAVSAVRRTSRGTVMALNALEAVTGSKRLTYRTARVLDSLAETARERRERDPIAPPRPLEQAIPARWGAAKRLANRMTVGRSINRGDEEGAVDVQVHWSSDGETSALLGITASERARADDLYVLFVRRVIAEIGWNGNPTRFGELRDLSEAGARVIQNHAALLARLSEWEVEAAERKVDQRRTIVVSITTGLLQHGANAVLAAHTAWELACQVVNHAELAEALPLLVAGLQAPHSRELRVNCASALAMFAETEMAVQNGAAGSLPLVELVRALHFQFHHFLAAEKRGRAQAARASTDGDTDAQPPARGAESREPAENGEFFAMVEPVDATELDELLLLLGLLLRADDALAEHARLGGNAHLLALVALNAPADVRRCAMAALSSALRHSAAACVELVADGGCAPLAELAADRVAGMAVRASAASALAWVLRFLRPLARQAAKARSVTLLGRVPAGLLLGPLAEVLAQLPFARSAAVGAAGGGQASQWPALPPFVELSLLESALVAAWGVAGMHATVGLPIELPVPPPPPPPPPLPPPEVPGRGKPYGSYRSAPAAPPPELPPPPKEQAAGLLPLLAKLVVAGTRAGAPLWRDRVPDSTSYAAHRARAAAGRGTLPPPAWAHRSAELAAGVLTSLRPSVAHRDRGAASLVCEPLLRAVEALPPALAAEAHADTLLVAHRTRSRGARGAGICRRAPRRAGGGRRAGGCGGGCERRTRQRARGVVAPAAPRRRGGGRAGALGGRRGGAARTRAGWRGACVPPARSGDGRSAARGGGGGQA